MELLVFLLVLPVQLGSYVWFALALGGVAKKAGEESWIGWVPIYNLIVFFRIARKSSILYFASLVGGGVLGAILIAIGVMLMFATPLGVVMLIVGILVGTAGSLVAFVQYAIAAHRINVGFGQGGGYTALAIFLSLIWLSLLAWGQAQWRGIAEASPASGASAPLPPAHPTLPVAAGGSVRSPGIVPPPPPPPPPGSAGGLTVGVVPPPPPPPPSAPPARTTIAPPPAATATPASSADSPWAPRSQPVASAPAPPSPAPVSSTPSWQPPPTLLPPAPPPPPAAPPVSLDDELDGATIAAPSRASDVEGDADDDRTIVAPRVTAARWSLVLGDGGRLALTGDEVLLGRKPVSQREYPGAQLLAVPDPTKTMSKNHALLRRRDDDWIVTDLASTNGVATYAADGSETVLESGTPTAVTGDFALGQARMRLEKDS